MKKKKGRHTGSESRRRDIIEAALAGFSEIGFSETSMEDIRIRSGASTGSIYHHFKSKEQLAAEVYIEGIRTYQEWFISALEGCGDAREGILAMVSHHLTWIEENAEWSRYLFQKRHSVFLADAEEKIASLNREFVEKLSRWLTGHMSEGTLRKLPTDIMLPLIFGPCMEFTRLYLSGHTSTAPGRAAPALGEAVWRALAAKHTRRQA
jgi:AcrR family transcriptional regulator